MLSQLFAANASVRPQSLACGVSKPTNTHQEVSGYSVVDGVLHLQTFCELYGVCSTLSSTNCATGNGRETTAVRLPAYRSRTSRAQRQLAGEGEGESSPSQAAPKEHEILQGPVLYSSFLTAFTIAMYAFLSTILSAVSIHNNWPIQLIGNAHVSSFK